MPDEHRANVTWQSCVTQVGSAVTGGRVRPDEDGSVT
jgi:hypothetical protein